MTLNNYKTEITAISAANGNVDIGVATDMFLANIRKVGTDEIYDDAVDVLDFEYEETDQRIEGETDGI